MKQIFVAATAGFLLAAASGSASAVTLPDGVCAGAGMQVTVKGGKIVAYSYQGTPYPVRPISASAYKIGTAGALRVRNPNQRVFRERSPCMVVKHLRPSSATSTARRTAARKGMVSHRVV